MSGRDAQARQHAANVRKLAGWFVAFPFTLGVAVASGVAIGIGALR